MYIVLAVCACSLTSCTTMTACLCVSHVDHMHNTCRSYVVSLQIEVLHTPYRVKHISEDGLGLSSAYRVEKVCVSTLILVCTLLYICA